MEQAGIIVLVIFIAIIGIAFTIGRHSKAAGFLDNWAHQNGYRLISAQRKTFFRGPFFFTTGKHQLVYRITVETPDGTQHSGYARVGGFMVGLFSDKVDVRWDNWAN